MKNKQNECFNFLSCDKEFFKFCGRIIGWTQLFLIFLNFSFLFFQSYLSIFFLLPSIILLWETSTFPSLSEQPACKQRRHQEKLINNNNFLVNNNHHNQNCNKSWTWLVITSPIWVLMGQWMCHVIGHCSN